jgi:hypothetical protein
MAVPTLLYPSESLTLAKQHDSWSEVSNICDRLYKPYQKPIGEEYNIQHFSIWIVNELFHNLERVDGSSLTSIYRKTEGEAVYHTKSEIAICDSNLGPRRVR